MQRRPSHLPWGWHVGHGPWGCQGPWQQFGCLFPSCLCCEMPSSWVGGLMPLLPLQTSAYKIPAPSWNLIQLNLSYIGPQDKVVIFFIYAWKKREGSVSRDCLLWDCLSSTEDFSVRYLHAYTQFNSMTYQAGLIFLVFTCIVLLACLGLTYNWCFSCGNNQQSR